MLATLASSACMFTVTWQHHQLPWDDSLIDFTALKCKIRSINLFDIIGAAQMCEHSRRFKTRFVNPSHSH